MAGSTMTDLRFYGFWLLAFLAFPIAGLAASWATGGITDVARALLGGAIAGAVLGLAQYAVLRLALPIGWLWVAASSVGLAAGLALATLGFGTEVTGPNLLWRGLVAGGVLALAQAAVLLPAAAPLALIWGIVVALGWPMGWWITRSVGVDLSPRWAVFGASGALSFQLLTGGALYFGLRLLAAR